MARGPMPTAQPKLQNVGKRPVPQTGKRVRFKQYSHYWGVVRTESFFVCLVLAATMLVRLSLAFRGWPYVNSDEATIGLMVDDILWHGAHPAFTYGEHHVGSLDAYLQAPFFAGLGPTNATMHVVTTIQIVVFLVIFYWFTRRVFSPLVARVTLLLLAFGALQELRYEMRAGHHAQDVLLLGALLLWLVLLRLGRPPHLRQIIVLDLGIGLVAGLGLWSSLLLAPFVLAAGLALGVEVVRDYRYYGESSRPVSGQHLIGQFLVAGSGLLIGLAPFIAVVFQSHGVILREVLRASEAAGGSPAPTGPLGGLESIIQQLGGTFIYGLPSMFGSRTVCADCAIWPSPNVIPSLSQLLIMTLIGLAFSGLFLISWLIAAMPLVRDTRRSFCRRRLQPADSGSPEAVQSVIDAHWWGRAMLVIGTGLTVLQYASTRASFVNADTAPRYLIGVYLGMPLIAAPLCSGASKLWRWLQARREQRSFRRLPMYGLLALVVLLVLLMVNLVGEINAFQEVASNPQTIGVPAGTRDLQVLDFLTAHHATRFYTTWWVCYRLMFDSEEHADCYIVSNTNPFAPGSFNRVPAYAEMVSRARHPAYVFDLTTTEVTPGVPKEISSLIATHDPRFVGYATALVGGYIVFYYAGA